MHKIINRYRFLLVQKPCTHYSHRKSILKYKYQLRFSSSSEINDSSYSFTSSFESLKKDLKASEINRTIMDGSSTHNPGYKYHSRETHYPSSGIEDKKINQYNKRLQELFRSGKIFQMFNLCDEIRYNAIKFNLHTYNWLLCAFEATKHPTKCIKVLDEMKSNGIEPSAISYSIVYRALATTQDITKAIQIYKEMIEKGILPTITIINSLLSVCQTSKKSSIALNLMKDVVEFDLKPSIETYCNLLECFCVDTNENNHDSLIYWLKLANQELKSMGKTIPTAVRDKVFVRFVNYDVIEGLSYMFDYNITENIQMDIGYLKRMLESIARSKSSLGIELAEKIYKMLKDMNGVNKSIESMMLIIYSKSDIAEGFKYLGKLKKEFEYELHPAVFDILCECLGYSEDKVDRGYFIIEEMSNQNIVIPIEAFNVVINNCVSIGDYDRAFGTYLEVKNFGIEPNEQTFISMLSFTGNVDTKYTETVLEEAKKKHFLLEHMIEEYKSESKNEDGDKMMYGQEFE